MKVSGTGRIVLWRGGSLWIGRVGEQTGSHVHHAVQITLALTPAGVRFRVPEEAWTPYKAALVPAHQPHAFDAPGETVVHVFAEPESRDGRALRLGHRGVRIQRLGGETERFADELRALFAKRAPDAELAQAGRAIEALRPRLGQSVRLSDAAALAHLSPERFRHLFLEQTGVRFRPYVLWLRLERALEVYAGGSSLTHAAQAGGFADSAHLSRTFRRMFGVAPASLEME